MRDVLDLSLQPSAEKQKQVFTSKGIKGGLFRGEGFWGQVGWGLVQAGLVEGVRAERDEL